MSEQQWLSRSERHRRPEQAADTPSAQSSRQDRERDDAKFDALLDEIDSVLETNAEEYVRSFVQKGGQ
ncbi:ubiquitin-like protein Pup [Aestuariimicrobium ganziense]|uniref:ubiquitin-like protein Pup n=1 Tax=Aestuariimicrobium ganziense TaxID=2773677 RepID=UPI0019442530|nr:ubiquitin-like protein Pup [Aestuariimicrobium ganziense]